LETARDLAYNIVPPPTLAENQQALRDIIRACNARGLTSVHIPRRPDTLAALQKLHNSNQLNLRCLFHLPYRQLDEYIALGIRSGFGNEWVRIGGVKIFSDGSLGSCTCHMLAPFVGSTTNYGMPTIAEDELYAAVRKANTNGIAVTVHAIGDRANVLCWMPLPLVRSNERPTLPNRIEHAQHLDPTDIPRSLRLAWSHPCSRSMQLPTWRWRSGCWADERCTWRMPGSHCCRRARCWPLAQTPPVETLDPWLAFMRQLPVNVRINSRPMDGIAS
jgi:predicted amidohydrolase YtcJ